MDKKYIVLHLECKKIIGMYYFITFFDETKILENEYSYQFTTEKLDFLEFELNVELEDRSNKNKHEKKLNVIIKLQKRKYKV